MDKHKTALWFCIITIILILFGLLYTIVGLQIFSGPGARLIPQNVLLPWESSLYGAIMIGWGTTLLLVGRIAFKQEIRQLKRALLFGIAAWLIIEAIASAWFGVWFNVGVDLAVLAFFSVPLLLNSRKN